MQYLVSSRNDRAAPSLHELLQQQHSGNVVCGKILAEQLLAGKMFVVCFAGEFLVLQGPDMI
jgi:hypothetical protein